MPIEIVTEALADVDAISAWYDGQEAGLGNAFIEAFHARLADIADQPRRFPRHARRTRVAVLSRFPSLVFYVIGDDRITVTGVFDGRRHPRSWSDRVRDRTGRRRTQISRRMADSGQTRIRRLPAVLGLTPWWRGLL